MSANLDLLRQPWTLTGHRPGGLLFDRTLVAEVGPLPIALPGSVQSALLRAGLIPDWRTGLGSRACEWVEHRDWRLVTTIRAEGAQPGGRVVLDAQGLDHSVRVELDGAPVATLRCTNRAHSLRLPDTVANGADHELALVIEAAPDEQGQWGFTSRSRHLEARYGYGWDWTARVVGRGVWDSLSLRVGADAAVEVATVSAVLHPDLRSGRVTAVVEADLSEPELAGAVLTATLTGAEGNLQGSVSASLRESTEVALQVDDPALWWPNGHGPQPLSTLDLTVTDQLGRRLVQRSRRLGFRTVSWAQCEAAPAGAEPWICSVNGGPVFLQGVNWTPVAIPFHDATDADYARLVDLYRTMGCTVLRIWGGGLIERGVLYDLCDQAGILLWQEMPLSSSGIENWPPDDPEVIAELVAVARSAVRRRGHHASLALWGGGNELMGGPGGARVGEGHPVGIAEPALAAIGATVAALDPDRRFVATSPSGPRAFWSAAEAGTGVHHDVHGPWRNPGDDAVWEAMWAADDSLLRSEVGASGAASVAVIERYAEPGQLWPPSHPWWVHGQQDWRDWDRFAPLLHGLDGDAALRRYVELTQRRQAHHLRVAASACRERFPRCGGFIVWMGHDCFPCPVNTSLIDVDHVPKPAYHALREVFTAPAIVEVPA